MLSTRLNNYIAAVSVDSSDLSEGSVAVAWMDISTGAFFTCRSSPSTLLSDLSRNPPAELLVSSHLLEDVTRRRTTGLEFMEPLASGTTLGLEGCVITPQDRTTLTAEVCEQYLRRIELATGAGSSSSSTALEPHWTQYVIRCNV